MEGTVLTPDPAQDTDPQTLRDALRRDLTRAMKAREPDAVAALRTAIAAIDNAEAVPQVDENPVGTSGHIASARAGLGAAEAARLNLTASQQQGIVRDQVSGYTAEAEHYDALGQHAAASRLRNQASVLTAYLR
jgi:hypothetical protein